MAYADLNGIHNPSTGGVAPASWGDQVRDNFEAIAGAWTAYTPSWTTTGTAPAVGNGSLVGGYLLMGHLLILRISLVAGTGTTFGTGPWSFSLPVGVTAVAAAPQIGIARGLDSGGSTRYNASFTLAASGTTITNLASSGSVDVWDADTPFVWDDPDQLYIFGLLEVA